MRSDEPTHDEVRDFIVDELHNNEEFAAMISAEGVLSTRIAPHVIAQVLVRLERAILLQTLAGLELRR